MAREQIIFISFEIVSLRPDCRLIACITGLRISSSEDVEIVSKRPDPLTTESLRDIVAGGSPAATRIFDMADFLLLLSKIRIWKKELREKNKNK